MGFTPTHKVRIVTAASLFDGHDAAIVKARAPGGVEDEARLRIARGETARHDATLDAWLTNPKGFAPGTKMTFAGLSDAQERANIIAYLKSAK